jgi:hypothetical protein
MFETRALAEGVSAQELKFVCKIKCLDFARHSTRKLTHEDGPSELTLGRLLARFLSA